jgi:desulfoferrodoxin (superoxide reductase-like protein)
MEGPEKIFICDYGSELGFEWHSESDWEHQGSNDIEYTRTDALIEKVINFLNYKLDDVVNVRVSGTIIPHHVAKQEVIDELKNYMKW